MCLRFKKLFIGIVAFMFFAQTAMAAQFIDVVEQSLCYDAVNYYTTQVPIIATDRDRFKPLDKVNKAEFFKLLMESAGYHPTEEAGDPEFYDVTGSEWYAPYVKKALEMGIIQFSEFDPNFNAANTVTRAQGLEWIFKFYGVDPEIVKSYPIEYNDVSPLDAYANISKIAFELQLLPDYKSGYFIANKEITRAETIYIFYQLRDEDLAVSLPANNYTNSSNTTLDDQLDLFYEVWDKITTEYIDKDKINENDLIYGAISGMITKLNDPYSVFFEPIDAKDYQDALNGSFDGIGIYLTKEDVNFVILTPLKGSPAEAAGLKPNDILLEIDDTPITGLEIDEVINMLRGATGTSVKLKIKRNSQFYTYRIVRSHIEVPYVESEIKDNIGIIYYSQFTSNSNQQFETEIKKVIDQSPKGLVIDFRNNPGGYLYSAQQLISRFIPANEVYVQIVLADGSKYSEKSLGPGDLKNLPIVILINEGTASASEIAALALKDQIGSKIIGTTSYGKAKIQEIMTYSDGSSLKLSIAKWLSPKGTLVEDKGIIPDETILMSETTDTQLQRALQLLN